MRRTTKEMGAYLVNTPLYPHPDFRARDRDDFGGPRSARQMLRRKGKTFDEYDLDNDFGMYLGKHGEHHVVMVKTWDYRPNYCEVYEDLAELKQMWELD